MAADHDIPRIAFNQDESARALGVTVETLRRWEREGRITASRPGKRIALYLVDDLKRLARTGNAKAD